MNPLSETGEEETTVLDEGSSIRLTYKASSSVSTEKRGVLHGIKESIY